MARAARTGPPRRDSAPLLLAGFSLLCTVFWVVLAVGFRPIGDYGVETDFYGDLIHYARVWMRGEPSLMNGFRGPVYYLVLGVLDRLSGDGFLMGKLLSALGGGASVWLVGRLVGRIFGPSAGLFGALFLAGNHHFLHYTMRACTDPPYLALYLATLLLLFRGVRPGGVAEPTGMGTETETARVPGGSVRGVRGAPWALVAAGVLAALATMTRYNGLVLVPAALAATLLLASTRRSRLVGIGSFLLGFVATMAPWSGFLLARTGNPLWNQNFKNVAIDVFATHPGTASAGRFLNAIDFTSIGEVYGTAPGLFLAKMVANLGSHFRGDLSELVGLPAAIVAVLGWIGAVVLIVRGTAPGGGAVVVPGARPVLAFALVGALSFLGLVPAFYNARFMLSLLPFWAAGVGFAGVLLFRAVGRVSRTGRGRSAERVAVGAIVALLVVLFAAEQARAIRALTDPLDSSASPVEILRIAEQARQSGFRFDADTPIAARKPHIGYYLGTPVVPLTPGSLDEVRSAGARYLLVSGIEATWASSLTPLLLPARPEDVPSGLEVVAQSSWPLPDGRSRAATLYAIADPVPYTPAPLLARPPKGTLVPGLGRLDTLRLRTARWIHFWEARAAGELLDRIEAQDHPDVLLARGDRALFEHDASTARDLYTAALPRLADPEPGILRIIAVGMLVDDSALVAEYRGRLEGGGVRDARGWFELVDRYRASGDRVATLPASTFAMSLAPEDPGTVRAVGTTLLQVGWPELARPLLAHYLELVPDDAEVQSLLGAAAP